MKRMMMNIGVGYLFLMSMAQVTFAQDGTALRDKTPEERAQYQTTWMKNKLILDSAQANEVASINLKYAKKNEPIIKGDGSKLSKLKQLKSTQSEKDAEMKKLLTPDQFKEYEALQEQMKDKMKEARQNK